MPSASSKRRLICPRWDINPRSSSVGWWLITLLLSACLTVVIWIGQRSASIVAHLQPIGGQALEIPDARIAAASIPVAPKRRLAMPVEQLPESSAPWPPEEHA